jgi:large subunit ribosomal protein L10
MVAQEKLLKLDEIKKMVVDAKAIYFADCSRIKAIDISGLRQKMGGMGIKIKVVKNRLTKRALNESGIEGIESFLTGPTALILSYEDPITPAKTLKDFSKKNSDLKIKGAYLDKSVYTSAQFDFLAQLPSKPELLSQLVGCLSQPVSELVFVLETLIMQLVSRLEELKDIRSKEEPSPRN